MLDVDLELARPGSSRLSLRFSLPLGRPYLLGVSGPSGSGKSSLLRMLAGLLSPDKGSIVMGDSLWLDRARGIERPTEERRVAYLPQNVCLFPHMTIRENLLFASGLEGSSGERFSFSLLRGSWWKGNAGKNRKREVGSLSELFGIGELLDKRVEEISGGQARKVALARMFLKPARLYLLDEPLSGIDPAARLSLTGILLKRLEENGAPALWVTHSPEEVACVADEMAEFSCSEAEDRMGWCQRSGRREAPRDFDPACRAGDG
jgi:ABC-type sugar transport system ATPase subunit